MPGYLFYKFPVTGQVFHSTKHTFALVNLKPLVRGHVLVVPKRQVAKLGELPSEECADFFLTVQRVEKAIMAMHGADAMNLAIQDGLAAGQSVPHLHCHLIPRYLTDGFGDGIYKLLEQWEGGLIQCGRDECNGNGSSNGNGYGNVVNGLVPSQPWYGQVCQSMNLQADEDRVERTPEDMHKEAEEIRGYMERHSF